MKIMVGIDLYGNNALRVDPTDDPSILSGRQQIFIAELPPQGCVLLKILSSP